MRGRLVQVRTFVGAGCRAAIDGFKVGALVAGERVGERVWTLSRLIERHGLRLACAAARCCMMEA